MSAQCNTEFVTNLPVVMPFIGWRDQVWTVVWQSAIDSNWAIHCHKRRKRQLTLPQKLFLLRPGGLRGETTRKGALEWQLDTESTIIIHDCQTEIFSDVWSWGWIIYSVPSGLLFQSGIWCCKGSGWVRSGVKWVKKQKKEWMEWLKTSAEGRLV